MSFIAHNFRLSPKENYILIFQSTNLKIYNTNSLKISEVPLKYICDAYITNDEKYLICRKDYCEYIYVYNLKTKEILVQKLFKKEYVVTSFVECDENSMFVCLESKQNKPCIIVKYNFLKDEERIIYIPNMEKACFESTIVYNNQRLYLIMSQDHQYRYYQWNNSSFEIVDIYQKYLNENLIITTSSDGNYSSIVNMIDLDNFEDSSFKKVSKESYLAVFKQSQLLFKLNKRKFEILDDMGTKHYFGRFTFDPISKEMVFYTRCHNKVQLYYLTSKKIIEFNTQFKLYDIYISFIKDIIIIRCEENVRNTKVEILELKSMLKTGIYKKF